MHIVYVTRDDMNRYDAPWIVPDGVAIELRTMPPTAANSCDGCVYDLDQLPVSLRQFVVEELRDGEIHVVTAVHSLSLSTEEQFNLQRKGVCVYRRLERGVFEEIIRKVDESVLQKGS